MQQIAPTEKGRKNNLASKVQSYPQTSVYAINLIPLEEWAGTRRPFNVLHAKEPFKVPADQVVQVQNTLLSLKIYKEKLLKQ